MRVPIVLSIACACVPPMLPPPTGPGDGPSVDAGASPDAGGRSDAGSVVTVTSGQLRGIADGAGLSFRGLPYAAPPVGPLRWAPPAPAAPWSGIRDASRFS